MLFCSCAEISLHLSKKSCVGSGLGANKTTPRTDQGHTFNIKYDPQCGAGGTESTGIVDLCWIFMLELLGPKSIGLDSELDTVVDVLGDRIVALSFSSHPDSRNSSAVMLKPLRALQEGLTNV